MDPSSSIRNPPAYWQLLLGMFFFAFTYRSSGGVYWLGTLLLLIWWIRFRPTAAPLPKFVYVGSACYAAIWSAHAGWVLFLGEYGVIDTLVAYRHYFELLLFIPLSVLMHSARQHLVHLLWVPVLAVIIRILHRTDYSDLSGTFLEPLHFGFGTHHVTFGMHVTFAIICTLGLVALTLRRLTTPMHRTICWVVVSLGLALLAQATVTSGSRTAWICSAVGVVTLFALARRRVLQNTPPGTLKVGAVVVVLLLSAMLFASYDKIHDRVTGTSEFGTRWLSLEDMDRSVDNFPDRRIFLAIFGLTFWQERPLVGHGPASVPVFLQNDPDFNIHPHLHNTYVQILVEGGLVGATAMGILLAVLVWGTYRRIPEKSPDATQLRWLLIALAASWALWNIPNFHLHSSDWRFTWNWFAAIAALLMRMQAAGVTEVDQWETVD